MVSCLWNWISKNKTRSVYDGNEKSGNGLANPCRHFKADTQKLSAAPLYCPSSSGFPADLARQAPLNRPLARHLHDSAQRKIS